MKSEMRHETESAVVARGAIAVGLVAGGACGSLVRLALSALQPATAAWPWMTTVINLTGAFLLGCITAYMAVLGPDIGIWKVMRLSLGTGLIGGYTTYSTLMLEVAKRLENGKAGIALAYLLVSVVVGLVCALLGFAAGRSIGEWHVRRIATRNGDTREGASSGRESADDASSSSEPDRGPLLKIALVIFLCVALAALIVNEDWRHGSAFGLLIAASLLGGLGAFTRYSVDAWVNNHIRLPFPCGTVVVNITACLAMGLVAGWCGAHAGTATLQYLLASGFLGGYSTFSTASVEGAKLLQARHPWWAVAHSAGMMVASLAVLVAGMALR